MTGLTLVIPAAGRGSRLGAQFSHEPKCLLPIGGRPILKYVLDVGLQAPIDRIVLIINAHGSAIREMVGDNFAGVPVHYVLQGSPLGLAHAITLAEPYVRDAMLVINGDEIYLESNLGAAWNYFGATQTHAVVGYLHTTDPFRIRIGYGLKVSHNGRVVRLDEKPAEPWNDLLGVGAWFLRRTWFAYYEPTPMTPSRGERDMVAVIQTMLDSGLDVRAFDLGGQFFNINTSTDLERACARLNSALVSSKQAL